MDLKEFRDYWDKWHKKWEKVVIAGYNKSESKIIGWPVPDFNVNVERVPTKIYKLFPEPYWGGYNNHLLGIFLSINPGRPQSYHDIDKKDNNYFLINSNYRTITQKIASNDNKNKTITWMKIRVRWLNKLLDRDDIDIDDVLLTDLVPWHTEKKSMIENYIGNNERVKKLIINKVLLPVIEISKSINGQMKNKIIVRGSNLLDILNDLKKVKNKDGKATIKYQNSSTYLLLRQEKGFKRFVSLLTTVKINSVTFFIFSGGYNMNLPDLESKVYPIKFDNNEYNKFKAVKLRDFIIGDKF